MTKKEKEELAELVAEKVMVKLRNGALREMAWNVFSTLGLDALEEVINKAEQNRKEYGHNNYMDLAGFYEDRLRGIAIIRVEEILGLLTKVHPVPKKELIKTTINKK